MVIYFGALLQTSSLRPDGVVADPGNDFKTCAENSVRYELIIWGEQLEEMLKT
jgi:hypothetical protein